MSEGKAKKRSKAFYRKSAHGGKKMKIDANRLMPGIKGFLCMCNKQESQAVRECYNILNEYADTVYGQGKSTLGEQKVVNTTDLPNEVINQGDEDSESEDEDIEKALKKEVAVMKTVQVKRFQNCCTKVNNNIFIRSTVEDPVKVCLTAMEDIAEKRLQRARYAVRLLPVIGTCKANTEDISKCAKECFPKYFSPDSGQTFSSFTVTFKARNNNKTTCSNKEVIPELTRVIKAINTQLELSWSGFDVAVLVEVVGTVCCLCLAPGFHRLRKYNLIELAQGPRDADVQGQSSKVNDLEINIDGNNSAEVNTKSTEDKLVDNEFRVNDTTSDNLLTDKQDSNNLTTDCEKETEVQEKEKQKFTLSVNEIDDSNPQEEITLQESKLKEKENQSFTPLINESIDSASDISKNESIS